MLKEKKMTIEEIGSDEYSRLFDNSQLLYKSVGFNKLNIHKCDRLLFLLFKEGKQKLGLIAGIINNKFLCPFSAPFSCFSIDDDNIKFHYFNDSMIVLEEFLRKRTIENVKFVLPPRYYNDQVLAKLAMSFTMNKYSIFPEIDHYYYLKDYVKYEDDSMGKDMRYKIHKAVKNNLIFRKASTIEEIRAAYDIISVNKSIKKYDQSIPFEELIEISKQIEVETFLIFHGTVPIASAILYNLTPKISQIIYWGNLPVFSGLYPMNYLAWNLFKYYYKKNYDLIDLGTSMEGNEVNLGLCNFKESLGCTSSLKYTFTKKLVND
jgi:hypothetical protein